MTILRLADGREFEVIQASRGLVFPVFQIYTDLMSMYEAIDVFDGHPEATETMTVIITFPDDVENNQTEETVYTNFTNMTSVQKMPMEDHPNTIMIRMQHPGDY